MVKQQSGLETLKRVHDSLAFGPVLASQKKGNVQHRGRKVTSRAKKQVQVVPAVQVSVADE